MASQVVGGLLLIFAVVVPVAGHVASCGEPEDVGPFDQLHICLAGLISGAGTSSGCDRICEAVVGISSGEGDVGGQIFNRHSFPAGFIFGAGTSAYQVEGASNEDGKGPSIWDTFTHNHPDAIADRNSADVAIDSYHRYKEDVKFIKEMNLDAHRFSISWSRILPTGSLSGGINKIGVQYYNNLIDELISNGIQPFVTLFHWDAPQGLEDQYNSFLSPSIVDDFCDYADLCFRLFGDRVKHWITINEPWTFIQRGYAVGWFAPGRCSSYESGHCSIGDSSREPYIVAHHMLLAHATAVKLYKDNYETCQNGEIGITLVTKWYLPYSDTKSSKEAVGRALDFELGWFMDPLAEGDYPFSMRALVGDRLPQFTAEESKLVRGSFDFIGLNYYTTYYAKCISLINKVNLSYNTDVHAILTGVREGVPIGPQAASRWMYIYPPGIRDLLLYMKNKYNNPVIYITENGVDEINNATLPLEEAVKDDMRIDFYRRHLLYLHRAIREGVQVKGYFVWSLFDNFEWNDGYTLRFGMNYIDYKTLGRHSKKSALWFSKFLKK